MSRFVRDFLRVLVLLMISMMIMVVCNLIVGFSSRSVTWIEPFTNYTPLTVVLTLLALLLAWGDVLSKGEK